MLDNELYNPWPELESGEEFQESLAIKLHTLILERKFSESVKKGPNGAFLTKTTEKGREEEKYDGPNLRTAAVSELDDRLYSAQTPDDILKIAEQENVTITKEDLQTLKAEIIEEMVSDADKGNTI